MKTLIAGLALVSLAAGPVFAAGSIHRGPWPIQKGVSHQPTQLCYATKATRRRPKVTSTKLSRSIGRAEIQLSANGAFDMRHLMATMVLVATIGLASQTTSAGVRGPPILDVKPSCEAAANRAAITPGSTVRDLASCMRDEKHARHQLAKEWKRFSPTDGQFCTSETKTGGTPSYVELLVCLEMIQEAKSEGAPGRCHTNTHLGDC
jgi:hypothetical protein